MFSLLQILQGKYLIEKDFRLKMLRPSYKFIGSDKVLPLPCAVAFGGQIARKLNAIRLNSEKGRQKTDFIETPDTNVELRGARCGTEGQINNALCGFVPVTRPLPKIRVGIKLSFKSN